MSAVEVLRPPWHGRASQGQRPRGVRAAFTLRLGGVSGPPYDSLNLGGHVGDAPEAVAENRRLVREELALGGEPVWLQQVHGTRVVEVSGGTGRAAVSATLDEGAATTPGALVADAAVTRRVGVACAILVADCIPVLFAAHDGSIVGAAHAGWRGLAGGVLEATVAAMSGLGADPTRLSAWLGPGIGQDSFEVGDEVRAAFVGHDARASEAFLPHQRGKWQCDLFALARSRLAAVGLTDITGGEFCTYADKKRFFSYRRDGQCGRMAALIWRE